MLKPFLPYAILTFRPGRLSPLDMITIPLIPSLKPVNGGIDNHFTFAAFNVLMPYPGTPFYERLKAEGRLLYDERWWLHPRLPF